MSYKKCRICGTKCSGIYSIVPGEIKTKITEIKETVYFCSLQCAKKYLGTIKTQQRKDYNKTIRNKLKETDREPSRDELIEILSTLTQKEKNVLSAIAVGTLLATHPTCKEFYKQLEEIVNG